MCNSFHTSHFQVCWSIVTRGCNLSSVPSNFICQLNNNNGGLPVNWPLRLLAARRKVSLRSPLPYPSLFLFPLSQVWLLSRKIMASVAVVGGGIIGLSSAVCILERDPRVKVTLIADKFTPNTTSDGAAGLIMPFVLENTPIHLQR